MIRSRLFLVLLAALVAGGCAAPARVESPTATPQPLELKIIAFNDFHGNLRMPSLRVAVPDAAASTGLRFEPAGGIEQFAALAKSKRQGAKHSLLVSAGDLVGATPLLSAFFRDEPTIEAMNLVGLDLHAVGNHEFDYGIAHLKRLKAGGCVAKNGAGDCTDRGPMGTYAGATFPFLAANVIENDSGKPLFPPYAIREFEGVKVAFIGLVLRNTPSIVRPGGTAGTTFMDEAVAANALLPELRAAGVNAFVVIMHEGIGTRPGGLNDCNLPEPDSRNTLAESALSGKRVAEAFDPAIGLVISGHTHRYYICRFGERLVTSAGSYGTVLTEIDVTLDRTTGRMLSRRAVNHRVDPAGPKDPALSAHLAAYRALAEPMEQRRVTRLPVELPNVPNEAGESLVGNLVADAHLASASSPDKGGAVIAFNNPRSNRAPLIPRPDGGIRYADLFATQPFQNDLIVLNLTGRQIKAALEQQFTGAGILNVSAGFSYAWDPARPAGQKVLAESMKLNGQPIDPELQYRVVANAFLAAGSEGMAAFAEGTDRQTGVLDLEALVGFLAAKPEYVPPPTGRIRRVN